MEPTLDRLFIDFSIQKLLQYSAEIRKCFALLSDSQIWERGGAHENAIGNLVLHLCGNVRQRIAAIAARGDDRIREEEFSAAGGISGSQLIELLETTTHHAVSTMSGLSADRLRERVVTGEFHQTVLESIYHMELHFALHSGQIFFATKRLCGEGLGFYKPRASEKHV